MANRIRPLLLVLLGAFAWLSCPVHASGTVVNIETEPLVIGETFSMESAILGEQRRINVYRPSAYGVPDDAALPVLYMPDGGVHEDFVHVVGLVQILSLNMGMRPFLLVGIENTERRRDLTGPTTMEEDRKIAPRVGGSAEFRSFIREELMPTINAKYATTEETAIVGESLAGLFVVETLLVEPELFNTYIAIDPSLWWDGERIVNTAVSILGPKTHDERAVYLAAGSESEISQATRQLVTLLREGVPGLRVESEELPEETHMTVYHPAALRAFRVMFAPSPE